MSTEDHHSDDLVAGITERLTREFDGEVPPVTVRDTVAGAKHDLDGQIVPEALGEMLHRLASYRLTTAVSTR